MALIYYVECQLHQINCRKSAMLSPIWHHILLDDLDSEHMPNPTKANTHIHKYMYIYTHNHRSALIYCIHLWTDKTFSKNLVLLSSQYLNMSPSSPTLHALPTRVWKPTWTTGWFWLDLSRSYLGFSVSEVYRGYACILYHDLIWSMDSVMKGAAGKRISFICIYIYTVFSIHA